MKRYLIQNFKKIIINIWDVLNLYLLINNQPTGRFPIMLHNPSFFRIKYI